MNSFTNIFNTNFKEYPQTPEEFSEYKLEFLHSHEPSYKELGEVLFTKDEDRSQVQSIKNQPEIQSEEEEDLFELEVQIKLRKYTSFQNGFMENHRKVLKTSLQEFLTKTSKITRQPKGDLFQAENTNDIKSILFNEKLFSPEEIVQTRERCLKKVDEFKILREMFENFQKLQRAVSKDAIMLGLWILKHTDHLVQGILHQNSFCINEVQQLKIQLLDYLENNENIDILKRKIAQETSSSEEFNVMIESWLYTLLIAKLGYFENDCFNESVSLEEHLSALLKQEKRQHCVLSDSDSQDDEIMSIELLSKKRKL